MGNASKSPFPKGVFRWIFTHLDPNPPFPPLQKGGEDRLILTPMRCCGISTLTVFCCNMIRHAKLDSRDYRTSIDLPISFVEGGILTPVYSMWYVLIPESLFSMSAIDCSQETP